MTNPRDPDSVAKQAARDRAAAIERLAKATKITPDDVARHPGEPDYDRDAR